ncbi:peptidoglycan-binding protein [Streptomyces sp. NPDC048566]|uniref:peptidoglycan-binding domain-containing protein n=1 Tax=Streptomyces sp. NPDC048566 TaxID=3365569 RepID=UPI00371615CD
MTDQTGHVCPRCAARRAPDGTPSCACTAHAADALRDARSAQAAATEDFDPLRIRPYVDLSGEGRTGGASGGAPGRGAAGAAPPGHRDDGAFDDAGAGTAPGRGADAASPAGARPERGADDAASTMRLAAISDGPVQAADATMRLKALPSEPRAADVRLFPDGGPAGSAAPAAPAPHRPGRLRRGGLLAAAGVAVTVAAAAGFAGSLLSYDTPARDEASPKDVRASVPDVSPEEASARPSASGSTAASAPAASAPSASASPSPSASASSSPSARASASPSPSRTSAAPSPTATATGSPAATQEQQGFGPATTLQRGDRGPEVTELQLRMAQLRMYTGSINGRFDRRLEDSVRWYQWARGITADPSGVYGAATRTSLEAETYRP